MTRISLLFLGGGLGTVLRYFLSNLSSRTSGTISPSGTLAVNLGGSLAIGCLWAFFEKGLLKPDAKLFLITGILGGFTTFSTFSIENVTLLRDGQIKIAAINVLASTLGGIALAISGFKSFAFVIDKIKG